MSKVYDVPWLELEQGSFVFVELKPFGVVCAALKSLKPPVQSVLHRARDRRGACRGVIVRYSTGFQRWSAPFKVTPALTVLQTWPVRTAGA